MLFVDHQPQMFFGVGSGDRQSIVNGTVGLAKAAKAFERAHGADDGGRETSRKPAPPALAEVFPDQKIMDRHLDERLGGREPRRGDQGDRTPEDRHLRAVDRGVPRAAGPVRHRPGLRGVVVADTSGGVTPKPMSTRVHRMVHAGAVPVTWVQILLELQRDWARGETYVATTDIVKAHGGAYGLGLAYAGDFLGGNAG